MLPSLHFGTFRRFVLLALLIASPSGSPGAPATAGRIAFVSGTPGQEGIYVLQDNGIRQARITGTQADQAPTWSPDGCAILFRRNLAQVYLVPAHGGQVRPVARISGDDPAGDMRSHFSPDGARILVQAHGDLFVIGANAARTADLIGKVRPIARGCDASWSPDGSRILFTAPRQPFRIGTMSADGTGARWLAEGHDPAWSPDGARIVFVRSDLGAIMAMNADGSKVTNLTEGLRLPFVTRPSWSPDGSRIAFLALAEETTPDCKTAPLDCMAPFMLYVVRADGTDLKKLADRLPFSMSKTMLVPPSWSPNGVRITFSRVPEAAQSRRSRHGQGEFGPSADIYTIAVDGSKLTRLTNGGFNFAPAWSPTPVCKRK